MNHIPTVLLAVVAAGSALGADWMQFRGPGGLGSSDEKGLPVTWSSTENIVWRTEMPGPGTSCPIVVGKHVYITAYSGYGLVRDPISASLRLDLRGAAAGPQPAIQQTNGEDSDHGPAPCGY